VAEPITEWEYVAEIKGWVDQIIASDPSLPFSEARVEQRGDPSLKRRDLTLLDRNKKKVLTGEVKLPFQKDGATPYNHSVVEDARAKAYRAKVGYFFTWNINEFVLWETFPKTLPHFQTNREHWKVVSVASADQLRHPSTEQAVKGFLRGFLNRFAQIYLGVERIAVLPLDDKFINEIESFLEAPIQLTIVELNQRYRERVFRFQLDAWMREQQGWLLSDDPAILQDLLDRSAKAACYALVIRLLFYEALLKRYGGSLRKLDVPEHLGTGQSLEMHLAGFFDDARNVTSDYETVFREEKQDIGLRIPFLADSCVDHWRNLIEEINRFDLSKLDYDVIGRMFERLIDPHERHKYGQYYTRPQVVDLINSFCINSADAKVMDPACGGGTFLVRAYARKKCLSQSRQHRQLLSELYGIDVSPYATHLTTINLAVRELVEEENYPQVATNDFFNISTGKRFLQLPDRKQTTTAPSAGLGKAQQRDISIPPLDAVVGNPPYVRQEGITSAKVERNKAKQKGTKEYYSDLVEREAGFRPSGRSDLHIYFWPHAAGFLKGDGWFGFLTSSQWLDVEYGFKLQEWILKNFMIVAIIESRDEPWFVGARVSTAITILRREQDAKKRMENVVRFIQLRAPIEELLPSDRTFSGPIGAAEKFRDEILSVATDVTTDRYRARLVKQSQIWETGVALGRLLGKVQIGEEEEDEGDERQNNHIETEHERNQNGNYYGGKWGVYLRAPDLWFELHDETAGRWTPLSEIADVWFGVKSGKDIFFFPRDATAEALSRDISLRDFHVSYGVSRRKVESGEVRIVACGPELSERRPIEAEFLETEFHTMMDFDEFVVTPGHCDRSILLVAGSKSELPGRLVRQYILWGEERDWHKGSTCKSRVTPQRQWYDLTGHRRGAMFWPMAQQYKHLVPLNPHRLVCNHRLFDVAPRSETDHLLGGILNSTVVLLSKYQFGRPVGVEGHLDTEVIDVNMMLVPDPRRATKTQRKAVEDAFKAMMSRKVLDFIPERRLREMAYRQRKKEDQLEALSELCELDMPDRRRLDDAVLNVLGVSSKERREELLNKLYAYLREFFEAVRQKEELAIENKKRAKRRGLATPRQIAGEITEHLRSESPDWLRKFSDFIPQGTPCDTFKVPEKGLPELHSDLFVEHGIRINDNRKKPTVIETVHLAQSKALVLAVESGERGYVRVPHEKQACLEITEEFGMFQESRRNHLLELIKERTADEDVQEEIMKEVEALLKSPGK
jgi:hypothetical protein